MKSVNSFVMFDSGNNSVDVVLQNDDIYTDSVNLIFDGKFYTIKQDHLLAAVKNVFNASKANIKPYAY